MLFQALLFANISERASTQDFAVTAPVPQCLLSLSISLPD